MDNPNVILADLDEIVFEHREKEYGAYYLRKKYNKHLGIAAGCAFLLFLFATGAPKIAKMMFPAGESEEIVDRKVVIDMMDLPPPPPMDEDEPPPPPPPDIPPPKISSIEFKVPEPKPAEEIIEEETIAEVEELEESNAGLETVEGDSVGYDFGEIDAVGEVAVEVEEPKDTDPDPTAFILAEKTPVPVNMSDIKKLIGYPAPAKEADIEGKVIVRILVDTNGKYKKHIVIKNPHNLLTKAVEKHLSTLEFTPAIQAGKPIKLWVTIPFDFKLLN